MSGLKELQGNGHFWNKWKWQHTEHEGCNRSAESLTNSTSNQQRHLTQTPAVHLKDAEEQEYPNSKSGGRQTDQSRNWDKMFMGKNIVTQSDTQTTHNSPQTNNFLSRDGKKIF